MEPIPLYQFQQLQQQPPQQFYQQQPHQFFQQQQNHQEQQHSESFRNLYAPDGEITPTPVTCFDGAGAVPDQSHLPYIPPFHVVGFAPGTSAAVVPEGGDGGLGPAGCDLQWNIGADQRKKRLKEQDFLENNSNKYSSQVSSVDLLKTRSVSTGLELSLDNNHNTRASFGESRLFPILGDEIELELKRQDAEIDKYLKIQGDRLRQAILEKVQADQIQTISHIEQKVLQKLREKEEVLENINKKNVELEDRMEKFAADIGAWQEQAKYYERMIDFFKFNLQQVYAQSRDNKEGCGDSEVDDTASCWNGRALEFHLLCKDNSEMKELMTCKVCRSREVCMLLLPCKHLCLCKDCESKLSICPLCKSSKFIGMEVYM